jgi:hypothetical protein
MWILVIGMVTNGLMNGPYYLQLAAGWTGLLVRVNAVLALVFVPLVVWLTLEYRAIGAAIAWCVLNIVALPVIARFMHRRLLKQEMWHWYWNDIIIPLVPAVAMGALVRQLQPTGVSDLASAIYLLASFALMLLSSSLASAHVRVTLLRKTRVSWRK